MKNFDEYLKALLLDLAIIAVVLLMMIPLFIFHHQDIPLGFLLGGVVGGLSLLLFSIFNKKEENHKSLKISIIILFTRILFIGGLLFLVGYLYYQRNIKIFNIFATAIGYLLSTITLMIVLLISKKGKIASV